MKILMLGTDPETSSFLTDSSHLCIGCEAEDVEDLFDHIDCEEPDVVIVDIDTCSWLLQELSSLRFKGAKVPIIGIVSPNCLSRCNRRAEFLEMGGSDLLEKPVNIRELTASADSLWRLHSCGQLGRCVEAICDGVVLYIDTAKQYISVDSKRLKLTPFEYKILELLLLHKGHVVTKDAIRSSLYGFLNVPEFNCIEVMMTRIRQKMSHITPGARDMIETIRRSGYRLRMDDL